MSCNVFNGDWLSQLEKSQSVEHEKATPRTFPGDQRLIGMYRSWHTLLVAKCYFKKQYVVFMRYHYSTIPSCHKHFQLIDKHSPCCAPLFYLRNHTILIYRSPRKKHWRVSCEQMLPSPLHLPWPETLHNKSVSHPDKCAERKINTLLTALLQHY